MICWLFLNGEGFPHSSVVKESTCSAGDPSSIPGSGRSAGEGIGYPLQYSWASLVAQLVKNLPAMWETWRPGFNPWIGKMPWRRERLPTPAFWSGESGTMYSPWGCKESDTTEWLSQSLLSNTCHYKNKKIKKKLLGFSSRKQHQCMLKLIVAVFVLVAKSCPTLFATPSTVTRQAPLFSCLFNRQEY